MKKEMIFSHIGLIIVVTLWGIAPIAGKYLFDNAYYSPALLVAVRGLLSVVAMAIIILITKGFKDVNKTYLICIPAGIILGGAYLFQFIGLESTTPAKNTFLESLSCIAVPLCMFILTREKPSLVSILAAIACLFGSLILCGNGWDFSSVFTAPTKGDIFSAIGGIFFGIDIAFTKVFAKGKNPRVYVFFQLVILTIIAFIYALPFEKNLAYSFEFIPILVVIFLGVFCTAICWVLRTKCIVNVSAVTCAVLMPMSAVIATFISIILRMEDFSWNVVVGGVVITLSIVLSGIYDAKMEQRNKIEKVEEIKENEQNEQNPCE